MILQNSTKRFFFIKIEIMTGLLPISILFE